MAKLHHAPVRANTPKFNPDNNAQRNIRASDSQSFEYALKLAKSERSEKNDSLSGSFNSMELLFNAEGQEDWLRCRNTDVAASAVLQPTQFAGSAESDTHSVFDSGFHQVRDLHHHHEVESALCPKQLHEMCDWLDDLIDQDRPGVWAFEFENDDAEVVELSLSCHRDGQWSACMSMDVCVNDQQQLDHVLRQRGVALTWANIS